MVTAELRTIKSDLPRIEEPQVEDDEASRLSRDSTDFALELYEQLAAGDDNLVISPYSISTAMVMAYAGARGDTAEEMANALHFSLEDETLHASFNRLERQMSRRLEGGSDDAEQAIATANALWAQDGLELKAGFLDTLAQNYGAGVNVWDFSADPEGGRSQINSWVGDKTNDKIPELLPKDSLTEATKLVLVNAVHYYANWKNPFDAEFTAPGEFVLGDGDEVEVEMMNQTEVTSYYAGDDFEALRLPYEDNRLSMWILLPEPNGLSELEGQLDRQLLEEIDQNWENPMVALTLPKFEVFSEQKLKEPLVALGMPTAFTSSADFGGITSAGIHIQNVYHDAFLTVDEKGTEAAAATAVVFRDGGVAFHEDFVEVTVDRPFVFLLRDDAAGTLLFVGRVTDPRKE